MDFLGVDFGGVIMDRGREEKNAMSTSDDYLAIPQIAGAITAIAKLARHRFPGRIAIVSTAGPELERRSREWLLHHDFPGITGVGAEQWRFCRTREEKSAICQELGVTHFIDDRLENLGVHLRWVLHRLLFRPRLDELDRFDRHLGSVHFVHSWEDVLSYLLGDPARSA